MTEHNFNNGPEHPETPQEWEEITPEQANVFNYYDLVHDRLTWPDVLRINNVTDLSDIAVHKQTGRLRVNGHELEQLVEFEQMTEEPEKDSAEIESVRTETGDQVKGVDIPEDDPESSEETEKEMSDEDESMSDEASHAEEDPVAETATEVETAGNSRWAKRAAEAVEAIESAMNVARRGWNNSVWNPVTERVEKQFGEKSQVLGKTLPQNTRYRARKGKEDLGIRGISTAAYGAATGVASNALTTPAVITNMHYGTWYGQLYGTTVPLVGPAAILAARSVRGLGRLRELPAWMKKVIKQDPSVAQMEAVLDGMFTTKKEQDKRAEFTRQFNEDLLWKNDDALINTTDEVKILQAFHKSQLAHPHKTPYMPGTFGSSKRYAQYAFVRLAALCKMCDADTPKQQTAAKKKAYDLLMAGLPAEAQNDEEFCEELKKQLQAAYDRLSERERRLLAERNTIKPIHTNKDDFDTDRQELREASIAYGRMVSNVHTDRAEANIVGATVGSSVPLYFAAGLPGVAAGGGVLLGRHAWRCVCRGGNLFGLVPFRGRSNLKLNSKNPDDALRGLGNSAIIAPEVQKQHAAIAQSPFIGEVEDGSLKASGLDAHAKYWYQIIKKNFASELPDGYQKQSFSNLQNFADFCAMYLHTVMADAEPYSPPVDKAEEKKKRQEEEEAIGRFNTRLQELKKPVKDITERISSENKKLVELMEDKENIEAEIEAATDESTEDEIRKKLPIKERQIAAQEDLLKKLEEEKTEKIEEYNPQADAQLKLYLADISPDVAEQLAKRYNIDYTPANKAAQNQEKGIEGRKNKQAEDLLSNDAAKQAFAVAVYEAWNDGIKDNRSIWNKAGSVLKDFGMNENVLKVVKAAAKTGVAGSVPYGATVLLSGGNPVGYVVGSALAIFMGGKVLLSEMGVKLGKK